jgi:cell division protein FtsA
MAGLSIMAVAEEPTRGYSGGLVNDRAALTECVDKAIERAGDESEVVIRQVVLAVTGESVASANHQVEVDVTGFRGRVSKGDCKALVEKIRAIELPENHVVLHQIVRSYRVDGTELRGDPIGKSATRLGANFHVIHGLRDELKELIGCVSKAGVEVMDVIFSPLASARAVLHEDDQQREILIVDIGSDMSGFALYLNGVVKQSGAVRFQSGGASSARLMEHFANIKSRLGADVEKLNSLILTGGGSLNREIAEVAGEVFGLPTRTVHEHPPEGRSIAFQNPRASAALGAMMSASD